MSEIQVKSQEDIDIWNKHGISIGKAMEEEGIRERQEIEKYQQGYIPPTSPSELERDF